MSTNFTGITFAQQKVAPSDDAIIRRAILPDGILTGCELSYSGSTLTMAAGQLLICGRQIRHPSAQNWAVVDATSGYARLLLTIDLTRTSSKDVFDQVVDTVEYASAVDGFADLEQTDINGSGTRYQVVACVVSLGPGGISGIVSQLGKSVVDGAGGLNFKVVGGVTLPSDPIENTIWVNTDCDITGWIFAAQPPSEVSEGLVWISTGTSSSVAFNASKKNTLEIYPISVKQYVSGVWVDKNAKTWQNESWTDWWNGELYEAGNLYESVTGGWTSDETTGAPAITYGESSMTITATAAGVNKKVRTGKKIDMSGWSTLTFEGAHENAGAYNLMGLLDDGKASVASVILQDGHSLDISSLTGEYYVYFQVRDTSRTTVVTKLYLT